MPRQLVDAAQLQAEAGGSIGHAACSVWMRWASCVPSARSLAWALGSPPGDLEKMSWKCTCGGINRDYEVRCVSCGLDIYDDEFNIIKNEKNDSVLNTPGYIQPNPNKIEPNSIVDKELKYRLGALIFGILLAIFIIGLIVAEMSPWEISTNMWSYIIYIIIAFGILGFIFKDKFFDFVMKVMKWFFII
ncbi:MAG: hypothetical protein AB1346_04540 [Thermodesulfobacteriota bacterium]